MKRFHIAAAATLAIASAFTPAAFAAPIAVFSSDVSGIFTDDTAFAAGVLKGPLTFSLAPVSGPITFFSALLNGTPFSFAGVTGESESFTANVDGTMPFALTVLGYSGDLSTFTDASGRYSLSISAAVPEPGIYALMLGGLLALGVGAMRRRDVVARASDTA